MSKADASRSNSRAAYSRGTPRRMLGGADAGDAGDILLAIVGVIEMLTLVGRGGAPSIVEAARGDLFEERCNPAVGLGWQRPETTRHAPSDGLESYSGMLCQQLSPWDRSAERLAAVDTRRLHLPLTRTSCTCPICRLVCRTRPSFALSRPWPPRIRC